MAASSLIGHFLLLAAQLAIGLALGWGFCSRRVRNNRAGEPQPQDLRRALALLQQLTASISADVRTHSSCIDTSNKQLLELMREGGDAGEIIATLMPVLQSNRKLQQQLDLTEAELKRRASELDRQMTEARTDALTGLLNRRGFDEDITRLVDDAQWNGESLFVLLLDIDHFKSVNDTYGHDAGDRVLRETARVIAAAVDADGSPARFGGEEFTVLLPNVDFDSARHIAVQIRRAVEANTVRTPDADLNVTVSIGIAEWSTEQVQHMLKRVDLALYAAKNAGRNRVYFHDGQHSVAVETPPSEVLVENTNNDGVTGLPTRVAFVDEVSRRVSEAVRTDAPLSLTVYGIDNLDEIGEQHDEHTADLVRRAIAEFLVNLSRDMDLVASVDREEFAVLLPGCTLSEANRIAERVRRAAIDCQLELPSGKLLPLKLSAGVADRESGDNAETFLIRAESAASDSRRDEQVSTNAANRALEVTSADR